MSSCVFVLETTGHSSPTAPSLETQLAWEPEHPSKGAALKALLGCLNN